MLNNKIRQDGLTDIGNLEQEFVYGDATTKELIGILNANPVLTFPRQSIPANNVLEAVKFRVSTVRSRFQRGLYAWSMRSCWHGCLISLIYASIVTLAKWQCYS